MKIFICALLSLLMFIKLQAQQAIQVDCCLDIESKASIIVNNNLATSGTLLTATTTTASGACNYKMTSPANTSAGVYNSSDILIRTLWSGVHFNAGCYSIQWDGKLDNGTTAPNGNYQIKILSNNVTYTWGLIGNSSKSFLNNEQYNAMTAFYDIALSGSNIYYATGYAEKDIQTRRASLNDLQKDVKILDQGYSMSAMHVATDAANTYWAGYTNGNGWVVMATKQSDDSQVSFTNGIQIPLDNGIYYNSCIAVGPVQINGVAVNSNYVYVSRDDNTLKAYNKLTGFLAYTNNVLCAGKLECTADGKVWVGHTFNNSVLTNSFVSSNRLAGTGFNPNGQSNNAQDNDLSTSDGGNSTGAYVGLDLGTAKVVNSIAVVPLTNYAERLNGAIIQGSNISNNSGFVDLYTIKENPTENIYSGYSFSNSTAYKYIRVYTPNSYANIAEFAVFQNYYIDPSVQLFTTNNDGSLNFTGLKIPAEFKSSISVSPTNGDVAIVRPSLGQVKIYNNTGADVRTLGMLGGYASNGPAVTYGKFSFYDYSAIKYGKDGSLWISDNDNKRLLHLTSTGTYIEKVSTLGINYNCSVDQNNPNRVFAYGLEFAMDYTKGFSVAGNGAWGLINNWGGSEDPQRQVCTFPNGKTYGITSNGNFCELRTGVGTVILASGFSGKNIEKDGSLWTRDTDPTHYRILKQNVIGYDGNNFPIWGTTITVVNVLNVPFSYNNNTYGAASNPSRYFFYQPQVYLNGDGIGYHLGSIKTSTNTNDWQTSLTTPSRYSGPHTNNGYFDRGGHSENCLANVVGSNVFWHVNEELGYYTQSCYTNQYNEDGLFIGQFGNDNVKAERTGDYSFHAGNSFATHAFQIPNSNDIGYITNDDNKHAAVQFVRVSNLESIHKDTISVILSGAVTLLTPAPTNLTANLPYVSDDATAIANNTTKWTLNSRSGATAFQTSIGTISKDSIDVYCKTYNGNMAVSRLLGTTSLNSWALTGKIIINGSETNNLEIVDINGKTIFHLNDQFANKQALGRLFNPISFVYTSSALTVSYLGVTSVITTPYQPGGLLNSPGSLRVVQSSNGVDRVIDVYDLKFVPGA